MTYGNPTIYLDHAATTPVDPGIVHVMLPLFTQQFGNPSSIYGQGQDALAELEHARRRISAVLGCRPTEVIFSSGATESNNLALKGVARAARTASPDQRPHLVVSAIEHHAVLHAAEALVAEGWCDLTIVDVDPDGIVSPDVLRKAIRPETCLVSIMTANNEIGTIQPIKELAAIAHAEGTLFHTDAVQAAGLHSLEVNALGVDLLSLSAHKFYGPKGVGVLFVRKGTPLTFQQDGGGQESGRRGGTENVPLIVGMGAALEFAESIRPQYDTHVRELRDYLWEGIRSRIPDVRLNGPALTGPRLANNLNISIGGVQGETVLLALDMEGVAASAGSACTTGNSEPSHVLEAIGLDETAARSSLRLTVGRGNTLDEMDEAVAALAKVVERVRTLAESAAD